MLPQRNPSCKLASAFSSFCLFLFYFSVALSKIYHSTCNSDSRCFVHVGELYTLLGPENETMRTSYQGLVDAIITDVPWGIIPGSKHDIPIPKEDIPVIVGWMIGFLVPGKGVIAIRTDVSPIQASYWAQAMLNQGMHVQYIRVMDTTARANSRCATNIKKPGLTPNGHQWVVGRINYRHHHNRRFHGTCVVPCLFADVVYGIDIMAGVCRFGHVSLPAFLCRLERRAKA